MELQELLQIIQIVSLLGGFIALIAVVKNDNKWLGESLRQHQAEDNRRFDRIEDTLDDIRNKF